MPPCRGNKSMHGLWLTFCSTCNYFIMQFSLLSCLNTDKVMSINCIMYLNIWTFKWPDFFSCVHFPNFDQSTKISRRCIHSIMAESYGGYRILVPYKLCQVIWFLARCSRYMYMYYFKKYIMLLHLCTL